MNLNRSRLKELQKREKIFRVLENINHIGLEKGEVFSIVKVGRYNIDKSEVEDDFGFLNGIKIMKEGGEEIIIFDIGFEELIEKNSII